MPPIASAGSEEQPKKTTNPHKIIRFKENDGKDFLFKIDSLKTNLILKS